ncbi:LO8 [Anguilla marmorata adomavirus 1]|uniref:LO8 n=1 Tax=Anguilla marmorata adomavirus 1 TaxID=2175116 RepID=A0A2S1MK47_9VIRU|nr:adenain-like proteinase [Marbled eel polyomavirus]AWG87419.1 LO8 [Anguilla marmorata adomavirus 1]
MAPKKLLVPTLERRTNRILPGRRIRGRGSIHSPLLPTTSSNSPFLHWGWLNGSEVQEGINNLGLGHCVSIITCQGHFCDLPHLPENSAVIFLSRQHYVAVVRMQRKLMFFDPLGHCPEHYFGRPMPQLGDIGMCVQPLHSPHCGNFCLLFLHILFRQVPISQCSKESILDRTRQALGHFLNVYPQPLEENVMVIEMFTVDFKIGEEFYQSKYRKFQRYTSSLSRKSLGILLPHNTV